MSRETNRLADVAAEAQSRYSKALEHGHAGRQIHLEMLKRDFDEAYRAWQREVNSERIEFLPIGQVGGKSITPNPRELEPGTTYEVRVRQEADIDGAELAQQERDREQERDRRDPMGRRQARGEWQRQFDRDTEAVFAQERQRQQGDRTELEQRERDRDWRRAYQRAVVDRNREEPPDQILGYPYQEVDDLLGPASKPKPKGEPMPEPGERFIELDDEE